MAKKDDQEQKAEFRTERLDVQLEHYHQNDVQQPDDTYAWHVTLRFTTDVDDKELVDLLSDMQVEGSKVLSELPKEVWTLPLDGCKYHHHLVKVWQDKHLVATLADASVERVRIQRAAGNKKFSVYFLVKAVPSDEDHAALEQAYLDAKGGQFHVLSIHGSAGTTGQEALPMGSGETAPEAEGADA